MCPFSQGLQKFNNPTKELERLVLSKKAVIDKSTMVLWMFGNAVLRVDHASNVKPEKGKGVSGKIDAVITMVESLGGYLQNPMGNDFEIFAI